MPETLGHSKDVRTIVQQERRMAVPKVMDPDRINTGQPDP
jgi:hypothetical protein